MQWLLVLALLGACGRDTEPTCRPRQQLHIKGQVRHVNAGPAAR